MPLVLYQLASFPKSSIFTYVLSIHGLSSMTPWWLSEHFENMLGLTKLQTFFFFSMIRFSNSQDGYCLISTFIPKYLDLPFDFQYYKSIPNHKSEILSLPAIASECSGKMPFKMKATQNYPFQCSMIYMTYVIQPTLPNNILFTSWRKCERHFIKEKNIC